MVSQKLDTIAPNEPQSTLPVAIGGTATILHSFLYSYDDVSGPDQVTYTVLTAPIHGTLLLNGSATTIFTQADIDNGLVQYRENGDVATGDGFTFTVSDQAGNYTGTHDYTIAIVNATAPVIDANATLPASIGGSTMLDKEVLCTVALGDEPTELRYTVLTGPAHGVLLVSGAPATSFTQADIDNHLVRYHENGDAASSDSFTFQATDAAGDQTAVTTFNIAIQSASPTQPDPGTMTFQDISLPAADWQARSSAAYSGSGMPPLDGTGQAGTWLMSANHLTDASSFAASQPNWLQGG